MQLRIIAFADNTQYGHPSLLKEVHGDEWHTGWPKNCSTRGENSVKDNWLKRQTKQFYLKTVAWVMCNCLNIWSDQNQFGKFCTKGSAVRRFLNWSDKVTNNLTNGILEVIFKLTFKKPHKIITSLIICEKKFLFRYCVVLSTSYFPGRMQLQVWYNIRLQPDSRGLRFRSSYFTTTSRSLIKLNWAQSKFLISIGYVKKNILGFACTYCRALYKYPKTVLFNFVTRE